MHDVDKIQHGAKLGEMPVEPRPNSDLVITLKRHSASQCPTTLLARADEVIE